MNFSNFYWFSLFLAMNGLILVLLAINVSKLRIRNRISYGDDGNKELLKAIRVHANGIEQVPIFSLLLLALTLNSTSPLVLSVFVVGFTLARCSHAVGMLFGIHRARQVGAGVTYLLQCVAAAVLLLKVLS